MHAQWLGIACDVGNGSRVGNIGYPFVAMHSEQWPQKCTKDTNQQQNIKR
jgi:hypothetical protein